MSGDRGESVFREESPGGGGLGSRPFKKQAKEGTKDTERKLMK